MKNWITLIFLTVATVGLAGCSMCCGPYDYDYPAFGGVNPRVDQRHGRLGSVFSDPNAMIMGDSADSNLAAPPERKTSSPDETDEENDAEEDLRKLERELEAERNNGGTDEGMEPLPAPDDVTDPNAENGTASRLWRNRPLRSKQTWR
ncbi:MAG: hypothetical protein AB8B55_11775 [Mariniblastus sp.]